MSFRRFQQSSILLALTMVASLVPRQALAQSQPEILPTGMSLTPLAQPGTRFQYLNPGLPTVPDFRVDMAVTGILATMPAVLGFSDTKESRMFALSAVAMSLVTAMTDFTGTGERAQSQALLNARA